MKTSKLKKQIVKSVFDKVHDEYDVMNDVMSLGSHRLWKKEFVKLMNIQKLYSYSQLVFLNVLAIHYDSISLFDSVSM